MKTSWATEQTIGILSVDNNKLSLFARNLLSRIDSREISHSEAKRILIQKTQDRIKKKGIK